MCVCVCFSVFAGMHVLVRARLIIVQSEQLRFSFQTIMDGAIRTVTVTTLLAHTSSRRSMLRRL